VFVSAHLRLLYLFKIHSRLVGMGTAMMSHAWSASESSQGMPAISRCPLLSLIGTHLQAPMVTLCPIHVLNSHMPVLQQWHRQNAAPFVPPNPAPHVMPHRLCIYGPIFQDSLSSIHVLLTLSFYLTTLIPHDNLNPPTKPPYDNNQGGCTLV
jgi:hypothetical protein